MILRTKALAQRIRLLLDLNGRSASEVRLDEAGATALISDIIRAAEAGKPFTPSCEQLEIIAAALGTTIDWLLGGALDPPRDRTAFASVSEPHQIPFLDPPAPEGFAPVRGILETGVYRATHFAERPLVPLDPRFPEAAQGLYLARDASMAGAGIRPGMIVTSLHRETYLERCGPIRGGKVVVIRTQDRGKFEWIAREVVLDEAGGRLVARPDSCATGSFPDLPIPGCAGGRTRIVGVATSALIVL